MKLFGRGPEYPLMKNPLTLFRRKLGSIFYKNSYAVDPGFFYLLFKGPHNYGKITNAFFLEIKNWQNKIPNEISFTKISKFAAVKLRCIYN